MLSVSGDGNVPSADPTHADDFAFSDIFDDMSDIFFGNDLISAYPIDMPVVNITDPSDISSSELPRSTATPHHVPNKLPHGQTGTSTAPPVQSKKTQAKQTIPNQISLSSVPMPSSTISSPFIWTSFQSNNRPSPGSDRHITDTTSSLDTFVQKFQALNPSRSSYRSKEEVEEGPFPTRKHRHLVATIASSTERLRLHESMYGSHRTSDNSLYDRQQGFAQRPVEGGGGGEGVSPLQEISLELEPSSARTHCYPPHLEPFRSGGGWQSMQVAPAMRHKHGREVMDCISHRIVTGDVHSVLMHGDIVISGGIPQQYQDVDRTRDVITDIDNFEEELLMSYPPGATGLALGHVQWTCNASSSCNSSCSNSRRSDGRRGSRGQPWCAFEGNDSRKRPPPPSLPCTSSAPPPGHTKRCRPWEGDVIVSTEGDMVTMKEKEKYGVISCDKQTLMTHPQTYSIGPTCVQPASVHMSGLQECIGEEGTRPVKRMHPPPGHFQDVVRTVPTPTHPPPKQLDLSLFFSPEEIDDILSLVHDAEGGGGGGGDSVELSPISTGKRKVGQLSAAEKGGGPPHPNMPSQAGTNYRICCMNEYAHINHDNYTTTTTTTTYYYILLLL